MMHIKRRLSEIPDVEVLTDQDYILPGSWFRGRISDMINAADLVVANLTTAALASNEVREELTRAHERGKKIIALVADTADPDRLPWFLNPSQVQHIRYQAGNRAAALAVLKGAVVQWTRQHWSFLNYLWLNLARATPGRSWFLPCLVLANLGPVLWYAVNKAFDLVAFAAGVELLGELVDRMTGPMPALWAFTSNWSVAIAALLAYKAKVGSLKLTPAEAALATLSFLIASAVAASAFYLSPINQAIRDWFGNPKAVEFLSTVAWSLSLSLIPALLLLAVPVAQRVFYARYLIWMPIVTPLVTVPFLMAYMLLFPPGDHYRGLFAGFGLRSGLFISLYVAALASSLKAGRNGGGARPAAAGTFGRLAAEWKAQAEFLASPTAIAGLPAYQEIIALGPAAVPLILDELRREPDHWFVALKRLTGEDPVPDDARGDIVRMAEAWLEWGHAHGIRVEPSTLAGIPTSEPRQ